VLRRQGYYKSHRNVTAIGLSAPSVAVLLHNTGTARQPQPKADQCAEDTGCGVADQGGAAAGAHNDPFTDTVEEEPFVAATKRQHDAIEFAPTGASEAVRSRWDGRARVLVEAVVRRQVAGSPPRLRAAPVSMSTGS
jgi:hypothetical protein